MDAHVLARFAGVLSEKYGAPMVLDVEHSIQVHRPPLTGTRSPSSFYLRPPENLAAAELIQMFEAVEGFESMRLTLTAIMGLDTYHQPLIGVDDFARKYFSDNNLRIVRVVGGSNAAIAAMVAFVDALKRSFSAAEFPHHSEFMVSGWRAATAREPGLVKLLFKPADPTGLMKVERRVDLHLSEWNLLREIGVSRHVTRDQPPELILSTRAEGPKGAAFLEALAGSLPAASTQDVSEAVIASERTPTQTEEAPQFRPKFAENQDEKMALPPDVVLKSVVARLADFLKEREFGQESGVKVVMGGTGIDVDFPRSARTLWLGSSFEEKKDMHTVRGACIGVRSDPRTRQGWDLHYRFDSKAGKLLLRVVGTGTRPADGAKLMEGI